MTSIIIADDDPTTRKILLRMLSPHFRAEAAPNGEQALRLFLEQGADLVLTDLKMPGMDGIELLRRVKEIDEEVVVFVITGHATVETAVKAMRLGAADYLTKPFDPDEVLLRIQRAIREQNLEKKCASYDQQQELAERGHRLVTAHPRMVRLLELARKAAKTDSTILVQGETGVGKELLVRQIHRWSPRRKGPFIAVNCSALSEGLTESELFGHEKGSFTGATERRLGFFEMANHGTLFLDEIGTTDQKFQVKLLRVLQDQTIYRVGSPRGVKLDVRVIAATNHDLETASRKGTFRSDLYFRLSVLTIEIPPLRQRQSDIPLLVDHFIAKHRQINPEVIGISPEGLSRLMGYDFPGNVRELENIIERAMIIETGRELTPASLLLGSSLPSILQEGKNEGEATLSLEETEKRHILRILSLCGGKKTEAAAMLGINKTTLWRKMKKFGIST